MKRLRKYDSASDFLMACELVLERHESCNSLMLGLCREVDGKDDNLYLALWTGARLNFAAVRIDQKNLIIWAESTLESQDVEMIWRELEHSCPDLPGLIGPTPVLDQLLGGRSSTIAMDQYVYELRKLKPIKRFHGVMIKAHREHTELATKWMHRFLLEAMEVDDPYQARNTIISKIEKEELYFLQRDEEIVSMACMARPTRHGISINYVYTPAEMRGQGYAKSLVYLLSVCLMSEKGYQFVTLFAVKANSAANHLYQSIGYEIVNEYRELKLELSDLL